MADRNVLDNNVFDAIAANAPVLDDERWERIVKRGVAPPDRPARCEYSSRQCVEKIVRWLRSRESVNDFDKRPDESDTPSHGTVHAWWTKEYRARATDPEAGWLALWMTFLSTCSDDELFAWYVVISDRNPMYAHRTDRADKWAKQVFRATWHATMCYIATSERDTALFVLDDRMHGDGSAGVNPNGRLFTEMTRMGFEVYRCLVQLGWNLLHPDSKHRDPRLERAKLLSQELRELLEDVQQRRLGPAKRRRNPQPQDDEGAAGAM